MVKQQFNILDDFVRRMSKLNIGVELVSNFPWIYLHKINGKIVTEKFCAEHGFTIAFIPFNKESKMKITDIAEVFKILRKYTNKIKA